jgi:hypothetical protein
MGTAAKTVIELFAWTDGERGGFLAMKRAKSTEIRTRFFQAHMGTDHLNNIGTVKQFLNE